MKDEARLQAARQSAKRSRFRALSVAVEQRLRDLSEARAIVSSRGSSPFQITPKIICDVEILTGRTSVLSYLLKPVLKTFSEALTER